MDLLVAHRFGVAIVESKSVSTSVRINSAGEWERLWRGRWEGMEDANLQGERQGIVLRALLTARQSEFLDRLLGFLQGTFTAMALDVFVAISDPTSTPDGHKRGAWRAWCGPLAPERPTTRPRP